MALSVGLASRLHSDPDFISSPTLLPATPDPLLPWHADEHSRPHGSLPLNSNNLRLLAQPSVLDHNPLPPNNPLQLHPPTPSECNDNLLVAPPYISRPASVLTTSSVAWYRDGDSDSQLSFEDSSYVPSGPRDDIRDYTSRNNNHQTVWPSSSNTTTTPAATTTTTSRPSHTRGASSLSKFLPTINSIVPTKASSSESNSGAAPRSSSPSKANKLFNDLFIGESAPVTLGLFPQSLPSSSNNNKTGSTGTAPSSPTKTPARLTKEPPARPTTHTRRQSTSQTTMSATTNNSSSSKFSWFSGGKSSPTKEDDLAKSRWRTQMAMANGAIAEDDEILSLDIEAALFPHGAVDPLNPSSFNDLLANATQTIIRLQNIHRRNVTMVQDMQRHKDAAEEEAEEAETRARHLRVQLDDIAARATEQEEAMRVLATELSMERLSRQEEEERRSRTLRMVPHQPQPINTDQKFDEHRASALTTATTTGSDVDSETDAESVFSQPRPGAEQQRPRSRTTTMSSVSVSDFASPTTTTKFVTTCQNCTAGNDGPASTAWSMVSQLREQNVKLVGRVTELEDSLEGTLDLLGNFGIMR